MYSIFINKLLKYKLIINNQYYIYINMELNNIYVGYLELCVGPMFAGKTTYLLELIDNFNNLQIPFTVIKPSIDNRYSDNKITSHDMISYKCETIKDLSYTDNMKLTHNILIEEGQFFKNLYEYVLKWLEQGKYIYIACLNGDYLMKPIGDIYKLYSTANKIIHKSANCECGKEANFTARIIKSDKQELIGGADIYKPVCRKCYIIINNNIET